MSRLLEILEHKREEVATRKRFLSLGGQRSKAHDASQTRGFLCALQAANPKMALIAEVKKASPSAGMIRSDFRPVDIAQAYERAGANCLSVLTDESFFQGSDENLIKCHDNTKLPCLRKDFVVDEYQIYEARAIGADAILLIVAALDPAQIQEYQACAFELKMDVLVEVHDEPELEIALDLRAKLIGVNNRNLATFQTTLETSKKLIPMIGSSAFKVSESALQSNSDVKQVQEYGAQAVLIGTAFCGTEQIEQKVHEVMGH